MNFNMIVKQQARFWCLYIGSDAKVNFDIARSKGFWVANDEDKFKGLVVDDFVCMVQDISSSIEPAPNGFPNFLEKDDFQRAVGKARLVVLVRVTQPSYINQLPIWQNDTYPYLFDFREIYSFENEELKAIFTPEDLESLRQSIIHNGQMQLLQNTPKLLLDKIGELGQSSLLSPFEKTQNDTPAIHFIEVLNEVLELQKLWSKESTQPMDRRGHLIRIEGPKFLRLMLPSDSTLSFDPKVEGRDGTGLKTRVPWIRIYDKMHSPSATQGWYVVFLFSFDGSAVYLSLNQGTTIFVQGSFKNRSRDSLLINVERARNIISSPLIDDFLLKINLHDPRGLGEQYEYGNVFARRYDAQSMPNESQLQQDLVDFLKMLDQLYQAVSQLEGEEQIKAKELEEIPVTKMVEEVSENEDLFASTANDVKGKLDELELLVHSFSDFLRDSRLDIDMTTSLDILAATLSSQFLLFAGPSGTGKSSLSRALARFFTRDEAWRILEAQRQWIGLEDAFGYYSPGTGYYNLTPNTINLIALGEASRKWLTKKREGEEFAMTPIFLIEEANLSAIEGYLAPIVHGVSTPSAPCVKVQLHPRKDATDAEKSDVHIPPFVFLAPFPRFFGTINVDPTSQAPARKISSRASIILLEPQKRFDPGAAEEFLIMLGTTETSSDTLPAAGQGSLWIGNPAEARNNASREDLRASTDALYTLLNKISNGDSVNMSSRDLIRCVNYMTYYVLLGKAAFQGMDVGLLYNLAAENAFLHVVLPNLSVHNFRQSITALMQKENLNTPNDDQKQLGGLLLPRLLRLEESTTGLMFAEALDFWMCLS